MPVRTAGNKICYNSLTSLSIQHPATIKQPIAVDDSDDGTPFNPLPNLPFLQKWQNGWQPSPIETHYSAGLSKPTKLNYDRTFLDLSFLLSSNINE